MNNTIKILSKEQCTGCNACFNKCPTQSITMSYDEEGFLYPIIDEKKCVECGLCVQVCPELNLQKIEKMKHGEGICYAVMANNEIQMVSSSGGMFTLLAEHILDSEGAVCGAAYTNEYMLVKHIIITEQEKLSQIRGVKYVQSDIEHTYFDILKLLNNGKKVLFVGCPCQVTGLYMFLGGDKERLYTVDLVCNGANSTFAYQSFLEEISNGRKIKEVNFRDKSKKGSTRTTVNFTDGSIFEEDWEHSKWHAGLTKGIINRKCCNNCRYAQKNRVGDITLGDFREIHKWDPTCDDKKGTSLVLLNSQKGEDFFNIIRNKMKFCKEVPLDFAVQYNVQLANPNKAHTGRKFFFYHLKKDGFHKSLWYGQKWRYDVGLVGWWFAANYGSVMTYYALGKILDDMNLLAIMIRIPKVDGTKWEPVTEQNVKFMEKYFPVSKERSIEKQAECNKFCDAFMVGSDQLWVQNYVKLVGYTFFLDFVDSDKKKIAYATSLGYDHYNGNDEEKAIVKAYLKRFNSISVRESSGEKICYDSFGINAVRQLDPVFLCNIKHYDMLASNSQLNIPSQYILCYILDPTKKKKKAVRYLEETLKFETKVVLDMKTFHTSKEKWSMDNVVDNVGIEDFIYLIKNCSFLLTDSHHGVCFGIIYHKNFICIANHSRGYTRFESLFNLLHIKQHMVDDAIQIINNSNLLADVDYSKVDIILNAERNKSYNWLKQALLQDNKTMNNVNSKDEQLIKKIKSLHNNRDFKNIQILVTLLRDYGIKHIVLSPGGRDVPLIRMFENNSNQFVLHRVTDERSAAYYGMGIATQLRQPVACVCTSGTAASNFLPAVTEAYYTGIPLIVITADRYGVYLNHGEDQTIPQKHIYSGVIKMEVTLPESDGWRSDYQTRRDVASCILESTHNGFGPVHINVPVDNISVGADIASQHWNLLPYIYPHIQRVSFNNGQTDMIRWVNSLKKSNKILVVYGQNILLTEKQKNNIRRFASKFNCVIVTDPISNLHGEYILMPHNMLQSISKDTFNKELSPDILISVGGKRLMNDPLTYKIRGGLGNIRHWAVTPDGKIKDFYFRLSSVIEATEDYFFEWFADNAGDIKNNGVYYEKWRSMSEKYHAPEITQFNSLYIQSKFFPAIPKNSILHLGVGQTFIECRRFTIDDSIEVHCNMGTNGIDGCTSTFMGQCAVIDNKLCFLIVGDLSFFYDMNSIWNKPLKKNIRILLVNNNGTGLLRGHNLQAVSSVHNTSAEGWVRSTGFDYISAHTKEEYENGLKLFFSNKAEKAIFFEVFCE